MSEGVSMKVKERVQALRERMKQHGVEAYLVPSSDPHQSEYVPECWQRRPWMSGFTGSAGDLLVTRDMAGLWTDGRYFLQADEELRGSGIRLVRSGQPGVPTLNEFLTRNLGAGQSLGVDPRTISIRRARELESALGKSKATLRPIDQNLVDEIWLDRPSLPKEEVQSLSLEFAGESTASKLKHLRQEMKENKVDAHVLSALDAIAWLFNIRGRDVMYNPVVLAYAIVTPDEATLFIDPEKVPPAVRKSLGAKIQLRPYEGFESALEALAAARGRVWLEEQSASAWIAQKLEGSDLVTDLSPVTLMKSRKNPVEMEGMRAAHVRDGAAVARFLCWLDRAIGKEELTEISAAKRLEAFRQEGEHFQGLSFRTISGFGPHGAIIHYSVTPKSDVPMRPEGLYLLDSGAQYLDGTTDITRTVLLGKRATAEQKDRFTRVLKGHIALARARFPQGVGGGRLDALARTALWEVGLDYNHGTGHGVGSFLNVHEGPRSIGQGRDTGIPIEPGNIFSNEPGYYKAGEYGIRIENLVLTRENGVVGENGQPYLEFETLTMCPIDTRLVELKLLTPAERAWLNQYHRVVEKKLAPHMDKTERAWLKKACAPI
jgi:Xaa-Pro aminopeptidase